MTHRTQIALLVVLLAGVISAVTARAAAASLVQGSFTDKAGSLSYELSVPSAYRAGTAVPLVVALHGCTETADAFRQLTHFDQLGEKENAIVVFPDRSNFTDSTSCWNWYKSAHMQRGSGEPALIAGLTADVMSRYSIDPHRVYVAGLSAGGAMASVMGATYPDVFAAAGVGSGCEYAASAACAGYHGIDPEDAGKQAYAAMGAQRRVMPVIVFQGDRDTTVPEVNAEQVVQQWQATDDWADDGARNDSIPPEPYASTDATAQGGRTYTVERYADGHDRELLEFWLVHGMTHAWSGGCACEQYSDPAGPDETAAMFAFFTSHPMP